MKYTVLAVGRLRPPFSDDVEHYRQMLAGHARVELVEVREDEQVERRIPARCYRVRPPGRTVANGKVGTRTAAFPTATASRTRRRQVCSRRSASRCDVGCWSS